MVARMTGKWRDYLFCRLAGDAVVSFLFFEVGLQRRAAILLIRHFIVLRFVFTVRYICADADIILGAGVVNTLIDILIRISQHLLIATGEEAADARQRNSADEAYFIP